MTKIESQDLNWFSNEFQASISAGKQTVVRTADSYNLPTDSSDLNKFHTEICYDITLSASDLNALLHIVKTAHKHEELQKRFPGIKEAWMNYMTMVSLTAHEYNWKYGIL